MKKIILLIIFTLLVFFLYFRINPVSNTELLSKEGLKDFSIVHKSSVNQKNDVIFFFESPFQHFGLAVIQKGLVRNSVEFINRSVPNTYDKAMIWKLVRGEVDNDNEYYQFVYGSIIDKNINKVDVVVTLNNKETTYPAQIINTEHGNIWYVFLEQKIEGVHQVNVIGKNNNEVIYNSSETE